MKIIVPRFTSRIIAKIQNQGRKIRIGRRKSWGIYAEFELIGPKRLGYLATIRLSTKKRPNA